jgi:hypothetical protein
MLPSPAARGSRNRASSGLRDPSPLYSSPVPLHSTAMLPRASPLAALIALALCTSAALPPTSPLRPSLRLVDLSGGGGTQRACKSAAEMQTKDLLVSAFSCVTDSPQDCESACRGQLAGTDFLYTTLLCNLGAGRKCCGRLLLSDDSAVFSAVIVLMPYSAGGRNGDGVCAGVESDSACAECAYPIVENRTLHCSAVDVPPVTENQVGPVECSDKPVDFNPTVTAGADDLGGGAAGGGNDGGGRNFPVAAAVVGGIGGLAVLAVTAAVMVWCCCYRNRKKEEEGRTESVSAAGYSLPPVSPPSMTKFSSLDADAMLDAASASHRGDEPPIDVGAARYGQHAAPPQREQPHQYPQYPPQAPDPVAQVPQENQWLDGPIMLGGAPPSPPPPMPPPPPPPPPQNIGNYPGSSNPYGSVVHNP